MQKISKKVNLQISQKISKALCNDDRERILYPKLLFNINPLEIKWSTMVMWTCKHKNQSMKEI